MFKQNEKIQFSPKGFACLFIWSLEVHLAMTHFIESLYNAKQIKGNTTFP
jgi:hypothetical protein